MKRFNAFLLVALFSFFSAIVSALVPNVAEGAVPQLINFQGVLKTPADTVVSDGSYSVTFTIYDAAGGGNNLWAETQSVTTTNGLFTVLLGSTNPVPDTVFYDTTRYLGMAVFPDAEMIPRQRLSSVGYSSVSSQWTSAGGNLFRLNGNVGIRNSAPLRKLHIGGGTTANNLFSEVLMSFADAGDHNFEINNTLGWTLLGISGPTTQLAGSGNLRFSPGAVTAMTMTTAGNVGIGTTSPTSKLDVVGDLKVSGNIIGSTPWTSFPFAAGFENYVAAHGAGLQTVQYRKIGDIVYLRGAIHKADHAVIPTSTLLGTLPAGFRPPAVVRFPVFTGHIDVHANGDVVSINSTNDYQTLDGMLFSTTP